MPILVKPQITRKPFGPAPGEGTALLKGLPEKVLKNLTSTEQVRNVVNALQTVSGQNQNTNTMNNTQGLAGGFLNKLGISGGLTFGMDQKKVNVVFWIIGGLVLVLIVRPFNFLSRRKRRR